MSQQQGGGGWGGPPQNPGWGTPPAGGGQGGGWGAANPPGGGYGPPPGGGGYGPPPGGGGYGPPPGGAPPGGGYGPPPGGYGAPPGGGFVPPPGGPMPMGAGGSGRVVFSGDGGELFKTYLIYALAPMFGSYLVCGAMIGIASVIEQNVHTNGIVPGLAGLVALVIFLAVVLGMTIAFTQKMQEFYFRNLRLDGQQCEYRGSMGSMAKVLFINLLLTYITLGIYGPWAYVNLKKYVYENTYINGQPGRLTFDGSPGDLLGKYIIGLVLTYCTLGIYIFWFLNDIFAFQWENTKLDGRPFQFRRDPGSLFGTLILNYILVYCTFGIYTPWMMCNPFKWEAEHVG